MTKYYSPLRIAAWVTFACALTSAESHSQTAFAATVVDYRPGSGVTLENPYAAVGQPGNIVGLGSGFDGVYSPFNPHYESTHLAQIGKGGELILRLTNEVVPIAGQPEIGLFTNAGLIDGSFPNGVNAGNFGADSVLIDVSTDGVSWTTAGEHLCDFPSSAFTDAPSPFHPNSDGLTPSDYGKPHALQLSDLDGMNHAQILNALDGSAGGTWIDLSAIGVTSVNYVRFRIDQDAQVEEKTFELAGISINNAALGSPLTPFSFSETFATNPIGSRATSDSGHASYANSELDVSYDLSAAPARTTWPLGTSLTDKDSFSCSVDFTINAIDFSENSFGQLSFGLINSVTTGNNRTTSPSNSWDVLTLDYFPSEQFPSFTPTVIGSQQQGQTDAFANLQFPSGPASLIDDFGEIGQLPTNTPLTVSIDYDAQSRVVTLRLDDQVINTDFTNTDNDDSTIQLTLPAGIEFSVDSFAILCWQESSGGTANLSFTNIEVTNGGPPANYYTWADANIADPLERATGLDADSDGLNNLLDYALVAPPTTDLTGSRMEISWEQAPATSDTQVSAWVSTDLRYWSVLPTLSAGNNKSASSSLTGERKFIRLQAVRP